MPHLNGVIPGAVAAPCSHTGGGGGTGCAAGAASTTPRSSAVRSRSAIARTVADATAGVSAGSCQTRTDRVVRFGSDAATMALGPGSA